MESLKTASYYKDYFETTTYGLRKLIWGDTYGRIRKLERWYLKFCNFLEAALIEVARSNLEPITFLWFSFTVNFSRFFREHDCAVNIFVQSLYNRLRRCMWAWKRMYFWKSVKNSQQKKITRT
jgi:hypothetical protein